MSEVAKGLFRDTQVLLGDAADLPLPDDSVDCVVTSPPYNCGMEYEGVSDLRPWAEYWADAALWCEEMHRVLKPGGRAWINIMPTAPHELTGGTWKNEKPGLKGGHLIAREGLSGGWFAALRASGLSYRDTVAWIQDAWDAACAWGSKWSPNAPNLRGDHEVVLLFHKGPWMRGRVEQNDIPRERWAEYTHNVWVINSARRDGHPAPYPAELVRRCIYLTTWVGDVVLDPFCGSGTTLKVAKDLGRVGIGLEKSSAYVEMSRRRIAQEVLL